jgi:hypothetical protein
MVGVVYRTEPCLKERPSPYFARTEKRLSLITLRHESQSIRKMLRTLKVSLIAVTKKIKLYDETERPRVTSAAENKFIRVTRNCSTNKCFTEFK